MGRLSVLIFSFTVVSVTAEAAEDLRIFGCAHLNGETDYEEGDVIRKKPGDEEIYLFRMVGKKSLRFDDDGYLIAQKSKATNVEKSSVVDEWGFGPRILPLVHPIEWEMVARKLFSLPWTERRFTTYLLKVRRDQIEDLRSEPHDLLVHHGEFFGRIHRSAIEYAVEFGWSDETIAIPDLTPESAAVASRVYLGGTTPVANSSLVDNKELPNAIVNGKSFFETDHPNYP